MASNQIAFDPKIRTVYGDGKYLIYRSIDGSAFLPYDESRSDVYVDPVPIYGKINSYKYKFVTGARDTPLFGPVDIYATPPPSPTPTCAYYKYSYSHVVDHPSLSRITGKYSYMKNSQNNVKMTHSRNRSRIIHYGNKNRWYMLNVNSAIVILYPDKSVLYPGEEPDFSDTRNTFYRSTINNTDTYTYVDILKTRLHWYVDIRETINGTTTETRCELDWTREFIEAQFIYKDQTCSLFVYSDRLDQIPDNHIDNQLQNTSSVYFYNDADDDTVPRTGWIASNFYNSPKYDTVPEIYCFFPSPTPTELGPPPEPTAIQPTPTPTPFQLPLNYFITELEDPILTETGMYLVKE